ncbi:peptidyl-tRNA hydrolase, mitochondrial isoform X3 [Populus alba]|uniref:peptidyl-tRNA hydrolase, mitochondrial isoform X3 n=1 Tax=Populus alba TaxID=43335 RepID=UPI003CC75F19
MHVGFEMIDAFAESLGISMNIPLCKALFGEGFVGDAPVLLAKPQTYMNLSGESAGPLAAYYKLPLNRVIVFHDDMELPCGVLRLQEKGGHGCHRGYGPWSLVYLFPGLEFADSCVKNFEECDQPFSREQRICSTKNRNREASWPNGSQGFLAAEVQCNSSRTIRMASFHSSWCCVLLLDKIDAALPEGVVALRCILFEGLTRTARWFNQEQKYKYITSETMST